PGASLQIKGSKADRNNHLSHTPGSVYGSRGLCSVHGPGSSDRISGMGDNRDRWAGSNLLHHSGRDEGCSVDGHVPRDSHACRTSSRRHQ
ncbi:hypothetical protein BaRGS_00036780, partial [Batillaria attramentaria]